MQLFATPHEPGSNPVIGNFYALNCKERKKKKTRKKRKDNNWRMRVWGTSILNNILQRIEKNLGSGCGSVDRTARGP